MADYKQIIDHSTGQWRYILPALGVSSEALTNKHKPCPACGGKDRFRYDDKQGRGTFVCGQLDGLSGDGFALVQHIYGCDFKEAARLVAGVLGITEGEPLPERKTPPQQQAQPQKDRIEALQALWAIAEKNRGHNCIKTYLHGRGLDVTTIEPIVSTLGFVEALDYWVQDDKGKWLVLGQYPAIVAKFEGVDGELMGLHRTYLNTDCTGKLQLADPFTGRLLEAKKMMARYQGSNTGTAIQLCPAAEYLAVCEGIENGAAIYQESGLPVWACGSAGGMAAMALPSTVKQLFVFADTDANEAGIKAARRLESRAIAQGIEVRIWQSGIDGVDVLDTVTARKAAA
ncbi:toprim domain-containing protein [Vitreoscilla massiliensis]|uniref:Toprim domain-containing protein n=1 Tax=Vitreoscilla massiliensis TaxID=1689272 RepID=A0ABY4DZ94_9NEIS|nr:toprim domain-containing protein [Vitreoscilla massiliensis]UOO88853.1 toprim domain-containing protein [Vitreoscilla massiliensis]